MIYLLFPLLLKAAAPGIAVVVLPLDHDPGEQELALKTTAMLREVLVEIPGVECQDCKARARAVRRKMERILRRCGSQKDCRLKVGNLLNAQLLVYGKVAALGPGILLDLELLDVGSKKLLGKVSRTLSGSRVRRMASLEVMLTEILFPERIVGALDIFLEPEGGRIYLDGRPKVEKAGPRIHLKDIPAGQHALRVEKPGYNDFYAIVQIPYHDTARLEIKMRPGKSSAGKEPAAPKPPAPGRPAWYQKWWVWTIVGGVALTATLTGVFLAQ